MPAGYFPLRSRTYGVFVFWRGFFKDPKQLEGPVKVMEQTRIYPLGKKESAKPMQFPNASAVAAEHAVSRATAARSTCSRASSTHEYVDPADMEMRGMLAALGIVKGKPFEPEPHTRDCSTAARRPPTGSPTRSSTSRSTIVPERALVRGPALGQRLPRQRDVHRADVQLHRPAHRLLHRRVLDQPRHGGEHGERRREVSRRRSSTPTAISSHGAKSYKLNLPKGIPAALFWSVTVYDPVTASGLDNGQPFPSINTMDKPATNADGSTDIYFGPESPGEGKNWLRTLPDKGFFVILRLYGPTKAFFDKSWKPGDLEKVEN